MAKKRFTAIILAAGSGSRMGTGTKKQYLDLCGHPLIWYSLRNFQESPVDEMILVCPEDDIERMSDLYKPEFDKLTKVVIGGRERYNSVFSGLCAIEESDYVMIHDGARPFAGSGIISGCMDALLAGEKTAVAAVPSKDTVKIADENGVVVSTPDRRNVWNIQTPQCFEYELIYKAYSELIMHEEAGTLGGLNITDDAMVVEHFGGVPVKLIMGSYNNIKITTPEDMDIAGAIMKTV